MKKINLGVIAAILAISASAFTISDKAKSFDNPYWFRTQADGTVINASSIPPQQAADPFGCSSGTVGCSKAYTGYKLASPGVYEPDGTLTATHMQP